MTKHKMIARRTDPTRSTFALLLLAVICTGSLIGARTLWPAHAAETTQMSGAALEDALPTPYPAPEFAGIEAWLNSQPLTLASLKGRVVLVDFWTYGCFNCVHTLPYVTTWDKKYRDQGLVIVGVHTPEFAAEKQRANVEKALAQHGIRYPVALDNQMITWDRYNNRYWPAQYLIDRNGKVVYTHVGEGAYGTTENNIRTLLASRPGTRS